MLTGAGHFGFGFSVGFILMLVLQAYKKHSLNVQIYAPFAPIFIGLFAALPYFWLGGAEQCDLAVSYNIFLLYGKVHCSNFMHIIFGGLNKVAIITGLMYVYIIIRYIALVKHCRRYGWRHH